METPIGDLVRLEQNQRMDYVDIKALQVLQYELMADILGGLFGEASGGVSLPSFTWNAAPKTVSIGEWMLFGAQVVSGAARLRGVVLPFNPSGSYAGSAQIDLSAHSAARTYERRVRGAQRGSHVASLPEGRGMNAGAPIITPVSLRDFGVVPVLEDGNNVPLPYAGMSLYRLRQAGGLAVYRQSLPQILTFLAQRIANLRTKDWTFTNALEAATSTLRKLEENTVRGVDELHAALGAVEDIVSAQPMQLAWGRVHAQGTLTGLTFAGLTKRQPNTVETDAKIGDGWYSIRIRSLHTITHVKVSPNAAADAPAASYNVSVTPGAPNHVVTVEMLQVSETEIASESAGAVLPVATIRVQSTFHFPDSGELLGESDAGLQVVRNESKEGERFEDCSGGSGSLAAGGLVMTTKPVPHDRGFWISIHGVEA